jgi:hypothetical protein
VQPPSISARNAIAAAGRRIRFILISSFHEGFAFSMLSITSFMKGKKRKNKIGAQQSGSDFERKKETADAEFLRLLRKPRKRSGAGFF